MKQVNFYFLALISMFLFSSCENKNNLASKLYAELNPASPPNTLTEKEGKAGWRLLFDGKTTTGWHGYNMAGIPEMWTIEDGCLTMNSVGGQEDQDIITDSVYRNFAFTLEYKMTPSCNSGIIFQVKEDPKYKFPYETGPEFQLIDDKGWPDKLEKWQLTGANYAMYPPKASPNKPIGEWNRLLLVVDGNHVTQMINGVEVVSYEKSSEEWVKLRHSGKWENYPDYGKFDEGHISLQNHGTKLWFRSIMIKPL